MTRPLLYIPIIHDKADLGSAANAIKSKSALAAGRDRWARHEETSRLFWKNIAAYLFTFNPEQLKIYQDGMPASGAAGRVVVGQASERGSRNYQIILTLLKRGAELRKTEDPVLLLAEHANIRTFLQQERPEDNDQELYRKNRDNLMSQRDKFIASTINGTLKEPEIGVLFIGAAHEIPPLLDKDIVVTMVKDRNKVKAYLEELLGVREQTRLEELGRYLASPVTV